MTYVLFTDTHFGVKQNSQMWLNSQMEFIYEQFIPHIKSIKDNVTVVHLGDVFDSRSTISTYVATQVVKAFKDIRSVCSEFIVIGGNHDFYSPNSDEVDSINLLLHNIGLTIVTKEILRRDNNYFIPWYKYGEPIELVEGGKVFVHADIVMEKIPPIYAGFKVFSGHVHIPSIHEGRNIYNLGSCYALNFADANSMRGFYILKDDIVEFIPNRHSIEFWRIHDNGIYGIEDTIKPHDYIEVYVSQVKMMDQLYMDDLNKFISKYKNALIIPKTEELDSMDMEKFEGYDISIIVQDMVPDNLKDKFERVLQKAMC